MNLIKCGSSDIYSIEYMCTAVDTDVTTISITKVKLSKQKHQSINKFSETTQADISNLYTTPVETTS